MMAAKAFLSDAEAMAQQHGLPSQALPTTLRALRRFNLEQLASGKGVSIPRIGKFLWVKPGPPCQHLHPRQQQQQQQEQLVFELSDGLMRGAHVQLGRGVSRGSGSSVHGVVEEVNSVQLALRYAGGNLSKADVMQALKLITQQILESVQSSKPVTIDLGPGILSIHGGLAEFSFTFKAAKGASGEDTCSIAESKVSARSQSKVGSSVVQGMGGAKQAMAGGSLRGLKGDDGLFGAPLDVGSGSSSSVWLTAEVLSRHQAASSVAGGSASKSRVSTAPPRSRVRNSQMSDVRPAGSTNSKAAVGQVANSKGIEASASASGHQHGYHHQQKQRQQQPKKAPSVALPPGASPPPDGLTMLRCVQAAREAAKSNARVRVAHFILPCGGPDDESAAPPSAPQGRQKPLALNKAAHQGGGAAVALGAAPPPESSGGDAQGGRPAGAAAQKGAAVTQVMKMAAERAERERDDRARREREALEVMMAKKAALDAEAEVIKEELRKKKKLLATNLASQVLERQIAAAAATAADGGP